MSTHGRLLVTGGHAENGQIILYAFHDGHTQDALRMLLDLPWLIFDRAKAFDPDKPRNDDGIWFYHQYMEFARERLATDRAYDKPDLIRSVSSMRPLEVTGLDVANWIVWQEFNRWFIVPSLQWCPHPGDEPDIEIAVEHGGYQLTVNQLEADDNTWSFVRECIGRLNCTVSEEAKITIGRRRRTAKKLPSIDVPFQAIIVDLLWRDIEALNSDPATADN